MSAIHNDHNKKKPQVYVGNTAIQVLEEVLQNIKLEKEDVKIQNKKLKNMVENKIIKEGLLSNELFKNLFEDIFWTGSFYEGLKISAPNEYDVIIALTLPTSKNIPLETTTRGALPGYVRVNNFDNILKNMEQNEHVHWNVYKTMLQWCDENGSLLQNKVRSWLEGILAKYIEQNKPMLLKQNDLKSLLLSKNGPAMTLVMTTTRGFEYSIDLVPAIKFKPTSVPPPPFKVLPKPDLPWYLIPKPLTQKEKTKKRNLTPQVENNKNSRASGKNKGGPKINNKYDAAWKVCCSKHEKHMINNQQNIKPAIKLIKKLRDEKDWKNLKSYFIKTAAFWEIKNKKIRGDQNLDVVFLQLLKLLQARIEGDKMLNFWDPRHNMLMNMNADERMNIAFALKRIIRQMEDNRTRNPREIGRLIAPYKD